MMPAVDRIPVTPKVLLSFGMTEWSRQGTWPISETDFANICAIVCDHFDAMCASLPSGWREALLSDIRFFGWLPQHLHAVAVAEKSAQAGITLAGLAEAATFYQPDWASLEDVRPRAVNRTALTRILRELRRAWLSSQLPPPSRLLRMLQPSTAWSFGARDSLKMQFSEKNNHFSRMPFVVDRLSAVERPKHIDSAVEDIFRASVGAICAEFEACFHARVDLESVLRTWLTRVSTFHAQIQSILRWKRRPKLFLVSSAGNATNRTMAAAAQLAGDRVVGFHHGNNPGYTKAVAFSYVEFALANEYISATLGTSDALRAVNDAMPPSRRRNLGFTSMNSTAYELLREQLRRPQVSSIRRVLVAGYPSFGPATRFIYGHGDFFAFRMPLELDIIRLLRAEGYEVAYKPHPETDPDVAEALQREGNFRCAPSFEAALRQADLVIFTYPLTTVLALALCTDLPLVMIDLAGRDWMPAVYETLRQRCVMVPAHFNERNLITFHRSDLLNGMAEAPSRVSDVYFDAYLRANDTTRSIFPVASKYETVRTRAPDPKQEGAPAGGCGD